MKMSLIANLGIFTAFAKMNPAFTDIQPAPCYELKLCV